MSLTSVMSAFTVLLWISKEFRNNTVCYDIKWVECFKEIPEAFEVNPNPLRRQGADTGKDFRAVGA